MNANGFAAENLYQRSFLHFAAANAGGAYTQPFTGAVDQRMHGLKIQVPAALCDVVGVTDAVPELRSTTAYFANLCHKTHSTGHGHGDVKP